MHSLADNIRAERARRRWNGQDLATRAGLSLSTIYAVEDGRWPEASTLKAIAAAFGVSVESLVAAPASVASAQANSDRGSVDPETQQSPAVNGASSSAVAPAGSPSARAAKSAA